MISPIWLVLWTFFTSLLGLCVSGCRNVQIRFYVCLAAPLLVAAVVATLLNRTRLSRFFWHPPLVFMALWALASSLIGLYLVAP